MAIGKLRRLELAKHGKKECSKCHQVMDIENNFTSNKRNSDGLHSWCKSCSRPYNKAVYKNKSLEDKQIIMEQQRNYRARPGGAAQANKYMRNFVNKDRDTYLAKNRAYRATPQGRANNNAGTMKYLMNKEKATPLWADFDKITQFYEEAAFSSTITGIQYHVDHIVPIQGKNVCGLHVHYNLQVITGSENCSKSNKWEN